MAEKDITEKLLTDIDEVFADIYNNLCFNGENIIKPDDLSNASVTSAFISNDVTRGLISDVSKIYKNSNLTLALLNIENQSTEDSDMPFRIIGYEGAKYNSQLISGSDERYAVATLVLNFNTKKRWSTPKSIKESLKNKYPIELDEYINDYKVNVIDVAFMDKEDIEKLNSDFKAVAKYYYLKRNNIEDFEELGDCNLKYPVQTFATMKALTGDSRFEIAYNDYVETHKDDKGVTMEKILDDLINKGKSEGKELQAKETAINLKNMNMDEETIAKAVGRDTETVKKWISFN
ncbi:MAG: Rpn family recombination-promoting nuclease/putative transposase [Solobacterium sp.]|nr:Rpn family recombination-promoting nuclease/putative transposase [Solobacterium sp.]